MSSVHIFRSSIKSIWAYYKLMVPCVTVTYTAHTVYMLDVFQSPVVTTLYIKLFFNEYGWFRANIGFVMWGAVVICMFWLRENGNLLVFWPQNNGTLLWNPHLCSWECVSSQINKVSFSISFVQRCECKHAYNERVNRLLTISSSHSGFYFLHSEIPNVTHHPVLFDPQKLASSPAWRSSGAVLWSRNPLGTELIYHCSIEYTCLLLGGKNKPYNYIFKKGKINHLCIPRKSVMVTDSAGQVALQAFLEWRVQWGWSQSWTCPGSETNTSGQRGWGQCLCVSP